MKPTLRIYLIAPVFLLFACKNTEKSTQASNPKIETSPQVGNPSKNNVIEKQAAAKEAGYIYDVWIYDRTGKMVNKF